MMTHVGVVAELPLVVDLALEAQQRLKAEGVGVIVVDVEHLDRHLSTQVAPLPHLGGVGRGGGGEMC